MSCEIVPEKIKGSWTNNKKMTRVPNFQPVEQQEIGEIVFTRRHSVTHIVILSKRV